MKDIEKSNLIALAGMVFIFLIFISFPVSAKEITVDDSETADFVSIQEAVNNSYPGDVIFVYPGTYNEIVELRVQNISVLSKYGNPDDTVVRAFGISARNITVSGFSIQEGLYLEDESPYFEGDYSKISDNVFVHGNIVLRHSDQNLLLNNRLLNGSIFIDMSSGNEIIGNNISNTKNTVGIEQTYGIALTESSGNIIDNNSISNTTNGICPGYIAPGNLITNNTLTSNFRGILITFESGGNIIKNNTISNNDIGLLVNDYSSSSTVVIGNRIELNRDYGIFLEHNANDDSPRSNLIYNNLLNNTINLGSYREEPQYGEPVTINWNTTKVSGTNIVGGPYIGGNLWAKPDGTGFSQICADSDVDGIADLPYNVNGSEFDYLPLVSMSRSQKTILPVANFSTNITQNLAPFSVQFTDFSKNAVVWSWDFDNDGIQDSTNQNPVTTYSIPGNYTVNLTVSNGKDKDSITKGIIVQEAKFPPVADFSTNATRGQVPLSVQFTDLSKNATARAWDFNSDGTVDSSDTSPIYTYTTPGTYAANLTVRNTKGTVSKTATITVLDKPTIPVANFSSNVTQGYAPLSVQFTDLSKNATQWEWNFGDGGSSIAKNPAHTYSAAGNYTVSLTATNAVGSSMTAKSNYINVVAFVDSASNISSNATSEQQVPLVADFNANVTIGYTPLSVQFTDLSQNITSRSWDFGDGTNSTEQNPMHTYSKAGNYTVNLTVNKGNETTLKTTRITVMQGNSLSGSSGSSGSNKNSHSNGGKLRIVSNEVSNNTINESTSKKTETGNVIKPGNSTERIEQKNGTRAANVEQIPEQNLSSNASEIESTKAPSFEIVSGVLCLLGVFLYRRR